MNNIRHQQTTEELYEFGQQLDYPVPNSWQLSSQSPATYLITGTLNLVVKELMQEKIVWQDFYHITYNMV